MSGLITTLKNIWGIKELRNKILYTLALLMVYRLGSYIVLPGVDPEMLERKMSNNSGNTDLLGLINSFSGGAFNNASLFALGVMPYITASIVTQLLGFAVPYFQRLQQHEGESGRKKLNQITRFLSIAVALVQGAGYLTYLKSQAVLSSGVSEGLFYGGGLIILTAGTIFCMWLGERITDKGIGNGTSLIIMAGIIASLPTAFAAEITGTLTTNPLMFIIELVLMFFIILATILVIQGVRRIPIQFAKKMVGRSSTQIPGQGNRDYLPIKVNGAGVMPIIFAQALMFLPATVYQFSSGNQSNTGALGWLNDYTSFGYNAVYFLLVIIFTYVYTALLINPQQYSEYLKRQNAFVPGVQPGKNTEDYIDSVTSRITLPGSIFLGLLAILPAFMNLFSNNQAFGRFFGGTSLLIMVGVILDTLAVVESYLLMQKYDGLVKSGRVSGRGGITEVGAGY